MLGSPVLRFLPLPSDFRVLEPFAFYKQPKQKQNLDERPLANVESAAPGLRINLLPKSKKISRRLRSARLEADGVLVNGVWGLIRGHLAPELSRALPTTRRGIFERIVRKDKRPDTLPYSRF